MAQDNDALTLATALRNTVPDASAISVIRALLSADSVIQQTFNGTSPGRPDAALARSLALTLAEAADDLQDSRAAPNSIRLSDLLL